MTVLDWICLGIIIVLSIRCLVRGFVAEILSVAAWIAGAAVALLLYRQGGALIHSRWANVPVPEAIAFAVIFLLAFLLTKLLGRMLKEGLEAANLAVFDRILGLVLGAVEGVLAVSLILILLQVVGGVVDTSQILSTSVFAKKLLPVVGPELVKVLGGSGPIPQIKDPTGLLPTPKKP